MVDRSKRKTWQKRTWRLVTSEFQLSIVELPYKEGENTLQTESKFKVDRKQISKWIAEGEKLESRNLRGRKVQRGVGKAQ